MESSPKTEVSVKGSKASVGSEGPCRVDDQLKLESTGILSSENCSSSTLLCSTSSSPCSSSSSTPSPSCSSTVSRPSSSKRKADEAARPRPLVVPFKKRKGCAEAYLFVSLSCLSDDDDEDDGLPNHRSKRDNDSGFVSESSFDADKDNGNGDTSSDKSSWKTENDRVRDPETSSPLNDQTILASDESNEQIISTSSESDDILNFDVDIFGDVCEVVARMVVAVEEGEAVKEGEALEEEDEEEDDDDDDSTSLEEAERLRQTIWNLKAECERLREEKRRIEEEEKKRQEERNRLAQEIQRAKEEFARLKAECDRLKRNLAKQEEEIARLRLFLMIARERRRKATMEEE